MIGAELADAFIEAAVAEGFPRNPDYNNGHQEGFGYFQATQKNGRRWSTARAFLDLARPRPNLRIETEALVTGVLFDGKRAVGELWSCVRRRRRSDGVSRQCAGHCVLERYGGRFAGGNRDMSDSAQHHRSHPCGSGAEGGLQAMRWPLCSNVQARLCFVLAYGAASEAACTVSKSWR
jgi:hypothetical protein